MATYPPTPRMVHPLPQAPRFVGRDVELQALHGLLQSGFRGVVALVGLGGAGKTAVAASLLQELLEAQGVDRPGGLLVWSFYQEPDAGRFLQEACDYFAGGSAPSVARGTGLLHVLQDALAAGGPQLLVLDGLERVQRQGPDEGYGQLEDPLLKGLLSRVAEGVGRTTVLVTSRFPLTDLKPFLGRGYQHLDVGGLDPAAARTLLRSHGVYGEDETLDRLIAQYGAHALTLDHLGSLIGLFLGGDPSRAPEAPALITPGTDRQALRLARLLRAYEEHLPAAELALLCRLCLLRRSVPEEQIVSLFLCHPLVQSRTLREIKNNIPKMIHLEKPFPGWSPIEQDVFAEDVHGCLKELLCQAPLAGPEDIFSQQILQAATGWIAGQERGMECDFAQLAHLYAGRELEGPTDLRPLSGHDRMSLGPLYQRYSGLRQHPVMPYKDDPFPLPGASLQKQHAGELEGHDILLTLERLRRRLEHLRRKHLALRRIRELCRIHQRKWSLAGPLAQLDAAGLRQVLDALVARHLILREADGSYSVHPAVRDHFYQLAVQAEGSGWHDILREQMVSLVRRPGARLPEEPRTLDLIEEAIYHALQAGRPGAALPLYTKVLGGLRHLAWKLGEMARGLRILRQFDPCPEPWDLAWYLRALGELDDAYAHNGVPFFRADIRLLQGRLPEVAAEGDSTRTPVAAFLMGQTTQLPPDQLGTAVPREQLLLYLGRPLPSRPTALLEQFYHEVGWEGDRARCQLLLAEAARRQGKAAVCRQYLDTASAWILHSGSVEHLCLLHLVQARAARDAGDGEAAQRAVDEGLHLARHCGLGLYHIELLCEQAEICLARADAEAAEAVAASALERAAAEVCRFAWGEAEAGHLLGQALAAQQRFREARALFARTLALRRRIGDPRAEQTRQLLASLPA